MEKPNTYLSKFEKLYPWFRKNNIASLSPSMAISLLKKAKEISPMLEKVEDQEIYQLLAAYKNALITVVKVAAVHQRAVIDQVTELVTARKTKEG